MTPLNVIEFVPAAVPVIARELGLLAEAGVEVETTRTRSSIEQRQKLMDNTCDVGLTAIDNLIAWNAQGDDLVVICQVERTTVLHLCVALDVSEYADLRGRALAVDAVDTGFAIVLRRLLANHDLGPGDYELLPAGGIQQRLEAITEGRAAGGLLGPPFDRMAEASGAHRLGLVEDEFPDMPGISAVARASRLEELADVLGGYVDALADAAAWSTDARETEAVEMLQRAGFDAGGAAELFAVRARDIEPVTAGVDLLYAMRRELGMLPEGAPSPQHIVRWPLAATPH